MTMLTSPVTRRPLNKILDESHNVIYMDDEPAQIGHGQFEGLLTRLFYEDTFQTTTPLTIGVRYGSSPS